MIEGFDVVASDEGSFGFEVNRSMHCDRLGLRFYVEGIARWFEERTGRPFHYEWVEPGNEQILPPREQRELDGVPSFLAIRAEEDAGAEPDDA